MIRPPTTLASVLLFANVGRMVVPYIEAIDSHYKQTSLYHYYYSFSQLGGEAGVMNPQMEKMKYVMRLLAVIMIGITAKFPAVNQN